MIHLIKKDIEYLKTIIKDPPFKFRIVDSTESFLLHKKFGMDEILEKKIYRDNSLSVLFLDLSDKVIAATTIFNLNSALQKEAYFWLYNKDSNSLKYLPINELINNRDCTILRFGFLKSEPEARTREIFISFVSVSKRILESTNSLAYMETFGKNLVYSEEKTAKEIILEEKEESYIKDIGVTREESIPMEIFAKFVGLNEVPSIHHCSTLGKVFASQELISLFQNNVKQSF